MTVVVVSRSAFRVRHSSGRLRVTLPQRAGRQAATRAFGSSSGVVAALEGSLAFRLALAVSRGSLFAWWLAEHAVSRVTLSLRPVFRDRRASSNFG